MSDASSEERSTVPRGPSIGGSAALFEHAPEPLAAVRSGESPAIEVVNRAYLERFDGRNVSEDDGGSFGRRSHLSDAERDVARRAIDGVSSESVTTKQTPDGHRQFSVRGIPAPGADIGAYLQFRDVTARRVRDQQLSVLRRVLRHDLRNDLTVVLGYAQTIAESSDDPRSREQAAMIVDAAADLRSVATAAGRMQCVTETTTDTKLGDATTRVRRSVGPSLAGAFTVAGPIPTVSVDRRTSVAMEELCRTLAEKGDATRIRLDPQVSNGRVTIELETDGQLCEQQQAALQGQDETKLRHATGLSPWIARWAVRAAGGQLRVENDDASTIRVSVPIVADRSTMPADD